MSTALDLKEAGFSDIEVNEYLLKQRNVLSDAGFTDEEINEKYPVQEQTQLTSKITFENPEKEKEKMFRAIARSNMLNIAPSTAYQIDEQLTKTFSNSIVVNQDKGNAQFVGEMWEKGGLQRDLGLLQAAYVKGDHSPELLKRIEEIKGELQGFVDYGNRPFWVDALGAASELLPIMVHTTLEGTKWGMV